MKYLIAFAFIAILSSLAAALWFMLKGEQQKNSRMARALALRVGLSIVLFACLLLTYKLGYIQPTGINH